ncbi:TadE/TadG family type IV pilus assembly protein [Erythrobacter sp. JK5]|uniref:TadE/TadG family type IV pilus assembly protein n=1 Tax=Erythrobacter sp. JK5 TaxID=2829500 RepID=UPI001BA97781|nr:TadE/TadG family type IV pilus assembly protein [Erythrobacter sp. JK5]QUL38123.1 pilus assembly protein [Erythrobacter sp. JK5]
MIRLGTRFGKDQRGSAAAEIALILPMMLVVLFSTFEAGHYFYTEHKIIKAVRQGARYAGRLPFDTYTCPSTVNGAAVSQIKTVTRTGSVGGTDPLIKDWTDGDITVSVLCNSSTTTGVFRSKTGGAPVVTVSATASYPSLFDFLLAQGESVQVFASAQATVNGI